MKKAFFFLLLISLFGCSNKDEEEVIIEDKTIKIQVLYEDVPDIYKPDNKAVIYFYYTPDPINLSELIYKGNGLFDGKGIILKPAEIYNVDENGRIEVVPLYEDKIITYVVEGGFVNSIMTTSSVFIKYPIDITFKFNR